MESEEVSAEVHFAQKLASNEKKIRDRAIKRLQKYLSVRSRHGVGLSDSDLLKIWKGLFYCMWMQDKPLIQEELSGRISHLLHCFPKTKDALQFVKVFLETYAREWNGIDKLRLDKFMMMMRDVLHEMFELLSKDGWQMEDCQSFANFLRENVMDPNVMRLPDGLKLHLSDIFVEELGKVSLGQMTSKKLVFLLHPFIDFVLHSNKIELVKRVMSDVIYKTLNTMSTGSVKHSKQENMVDREEQDDEEPMEEDSGEDENNTESEVQLLELDLGLLLMVMFKLAGRKDVSAPNRKIVYKLIQKHQDMYNNYINSSESSTVTNQEEDVNEEESERSGDCITDKDLNFLLDGGKAADQQQAETSRKKRRRRKMKNMKLESESVMENGVFQSDEAPHKKLPKKRKHTHGDDNVVNLGDNVLSSYELSLNLDNKKENVHGGTDSSDIHLLKDIHVSENEGRQMKAKKLKLSSSHNENKLNSNADHGTNSQKKKKTSLNNQSISENGSESCVQIMVSASGENANSNARSRSRSPSPRKQSPIAVPVELVIYQRSSATRLHSSPERKEYTVRSPAEPSSPSRSRRAGLLGSYSENSSIPGVVGVAHSMIVNDDPRQRSKPKTPKQDSAGSSSVMLPSPSQLFHKHTKKTKSENKKKTRILNPQFQNQTVGAGSSSPSADPQSQGQPVHSQPQGQYVNPQSKDLDIDSTSSVVQDLCTALAGPCSMVKKAIAMVTPQPGPESRFEEDKKRAMSAENTPGTKKKVIFDLRKNKANKIQDYLKSVAQQPDSPHTPAKSPSAGILKSPAPSPAPGTDSPMETDSAVSIDSSSVSSSTSVTKTRKRSRSKRRASAPSSSGAKANRRQGKLKNRRSLSPQRRHSSSPSPSPSRSKQKIKQRGRAQK